MSRAKVYSGWTQLAVAALAMVATLPGRTQGLGLVTEPLIADLGLDRVTYANVNLWATLIGAALCIPCGRWLDRFGSRVVLTAVIATLGVAVVAMSLGTGIAVLAVTVTLTRGAGQSALSVASLALVGKWFARRLDHAMAIFAVLVAVGFIAAFPSVGQAVQSFGWRPTWLAIGLVELVVLAPLVAILVRNSPEGQGLAVDGVADASDHAAADFTLWEALRTPAFWIFALSSSIFGLVYSGIALFNESILAERGFDAGTYYRVLVISTMVGLAANFGAGFLASRWSLPRVMAIGMAVLAMALCALPLVATESHVVLYGLAMGAAGGVVTVVFFSVWGRAFGRIHLGRIQGAAQMMTVLASALGPLLLALTLSRTGSYGSIFYLLAAIVALLAIGCWFVALPTLRRSSGAESAAAVGSTS